MIGIVETKKQATDTAENVHTSKPSAIACAVETRAQLAGKAKGLSALAAVRVSAVNVTAKEFQTEQGKDDTLKKCFVAAEKISTEDGKRNHYRVVDDLLYRTFNRGDGEVWKQPVVPNSLREQVMCIGHDSHVRTLRVKKSSDSILRSFYWPGILRDVTRYCQSCDICQRTVNHGNLFS